MDLGLGAQFWALRTSYFWEGCVLLHVQPQTHTGPPDGVDGLECSFKRRQDMSHIFKLKRDMKLW